MQTKMSLESESSLKDTLVGSKKDLCEPRGEVRLVRLHVHVSVDCV